MKKQKIVQIRDPVLLCGACYWLLARDATGLLRMGLWAALLHESGHIAAWVLLVHQLPQIRVGLGGMCLQRQQEELSGLRLLGLAEPVRAMVEDRLWVCLLQFAAGRV